jgi:NAD-dependent dihydropyrimidine dehydrogenase PreA subunit
MDTLRYISGVTTLKLDDEKCIGCGSCEEVCPHRVFKMENKKAEIIDIDGCMECGACAMNCPSEAVKVTPGVGCAAYIIQTWIKGKDDACSSGLCC